MAAERDAKPQRLAPEALPKDNGPAWTLRDQGRSAQSGSGQDGSDQDGTGTAGPPDTVAVALEHDGGALPRVVASGKGFVAEQILALAFANDVRVRRDADLAQILSLVDLDSDIPTEAFAAVAEILAYVYKANGNTTPWLDVTTS